MRDDGEQIGSGESVLIGALEPAAREGLLGLARRVTFPAGAAIYSYGDPGDTMLVIEKGRIEISVTTKSGRKSVLNVMGPGEALGEVAMLDRRPRSADATAATEVSALQLHRSDIMSFLQRNPGATMALMAELCAKVRNASELFAAQSNTDASVRLSRCILRLAAKWGSIRADGTVRVDVALSQADIGEFSGLVRENVNRHLRRWAEEALLEFDRDGFTVLKPDRMTEIAGL